MHIHKNSYAIRSLLTSSILCLLVTGCLTKEGYQYQEVYRNPNTQTLVRAVYHSDGIVTITGDGYYGDEYEFERLEMYDWELNRWYTVVKDEESGKYIWTTDALEKRKLDTRRKKRDMSRTRASEGRE